MVKMEAVDDIVESVETSEEPLLGQLDIILIAVIIIVLSCYYFKRKPEEKTEISLDSFTLS